MKATCVVSIFADGRRKEVVEDVFDLAEVSDIGPTKVADNERITINAIAKPNLIPLVSQLPFNIYDLLLDRSISNMYSPICCRRKFRVMRYHNYSPFKFTRQHRH